jgi:hypothetical protein
MTSTIKQPTHMKHSILPTVNTVRARDAGAFGFCMYTGDAGAVGLCIHKDNATYIRLESSTVYFKSTLAHMRHTMQWMRYDMKARSITTFMNR